MSKTERLIWIDLEMTGLDPEANTIIEIATLITTGDLELVAEGPSLAVHQPEEALALMDEWNVTHHTASGLLARVKASSIDLAEAERLTLAFVQEHTEPRSSPLCGNSIWQDRHFLRRYMPTLHDHMHYRCIDVSTIKELTRRWYPPAMHTPKKKGAHLAMDDIRESVEELRFYRDTIMVKPQ